MNMRTKIKIMEFLKSKGTGGVIDAGYVEIDPLTATLDLWYDGEDGRRDVYELSDVTEFLEFLARD